MSPDFWTHLGTVKYWTYGIFLGSLSSYASGSISGMFSCIMATYARLLPAKIWNILKKKAWRDEHMENMLTEKFNRTSPLETRPRQNGVLYTKEFRWILPHFFFCCCCSFSWLDLYRSFEAFGLKSCQELELRVREKENDYVNRPVSGSIGWINYFQNTRWWPLVKFQARLLSAIIKQTRI